MIDSWTSLKLFVNLESKGLLKLLESYSHWKKQLCITAIAAAKFKFTFELEMHQKSIFRNQLLCLHLTVLHPYKIE